MRLALALTIAIALPCPASAQTFKEISVKVKKDGTVLYRGSAVGKASLPPAPRKVDARGLGVYGRKVVLVTISGKDGRKGELLFTVGSKPAVIFNGSTGPQGVDGEWSRHLKVGPNSVLLYQRRLGDARCDGEPVFLFPRMYDFASESFRSVSMRPDVKGLPQITASRAAVGVPAGPPLNTFRQAFVSTQRGDDQRAANLAAAGELEDGDPKTSWSETLGGHGQGEVLTARGQPSRYRLRAIRVLPGDAAGKKAFGNANRLKSLVVALSKGHRYLAVFPKDPLKDRGKIHTPYWIVLPKPVATRCVSLILNEVYPGRLAGGKRGGGRTAISEVRFFTDLEFGGGMKQLVKDLSSSDQRRADAAVAVLSRLGAEGVKVVGQQMPGASGVALGRMARVLARSRRPEAAAPLAAALTRLGSVQQRMVLDALTRLGSASVPALAALLDHKGAPTQGIALALGTIGGQAAREALVARAGSGDVARRAAMVEGLSRLRTAEDLEALVFAAAQAKDTVKQADLILASARMGHGVPDGRAAAAKHLAGLWARATDFEVRYRLLGALGALDPAAHLPLLVTASRPASEKDAVLRWIAVQQIRRIKSAEATAALLLAAGDASPRVRAATARSLGDRPTSAAVTTGLISLARKDPWAVVAGAAAASLGSHCGEKAVATLREVVRRGSRGLGVDLRALNSLGRCNPKGLGPFLLAMAGDERWRDGMREHAVVLFTPKLARAHAAGLIKLFKKVRKKTMVSVGAQKVTVAATEVVARLGGKAAADALDDALALNMNPLVRVAAALALGKVCHKSTLATLKERAHKDPEIRVRHAAAKSIRKCGWR